MIGKIVCISLFMLGVFITQNYPGVQATNGDPRFRDGDVRTDSSNDNAALNQNYIVIPQGSSSSCGRGRGILGGALSSLLGSSC